jgi:hypothetical protein
VIATTPDPPPATPRPTRSTPKLGASAATVDPEPIRRIPASSMRPGAIRLVTAPTGRSTTSRASPQTEVVSATAVRLRSKVSRRVGRIGTATAVPSWARKTVT